MVFVHTREIYRKTYIGPMYIFFIIDLDWIGYRRRWNGMVETEVTSIIRYVRATITSLQLPHHSISGYIDFLTSDRNRRFALLHRQDFSSDEVYNRSLGLLEESVRHKTPVDIIVEGRTWLNKDNKLRTKHYVTGIEGRY